MSAHVRGTLYKETVSGNRGQTEKDCIAALNQRLEDQGPLNVQRLKLQGKSYIGDPALNTC